MRKWRTTVYVSTRLFRCRLDDCMRIATRSYGTPGVVKRSGGSGPASRELQSSSTLTSRNWRGSDVPLPLDDGQRKRRSKKADGNLFGVVCGTETEREPESRARTLHNLASLSLRVASSAPCPACSCRLAHADNDKRGRKGYCVGTIHAQPMLEPTGMAAVAAELPGSTSAVQPMTPVDGTPCAVRGVGSVHLVGEVQSNCALAPSPSTCPRYPVVGAGTATILLGPAFSSRVVVAVLSTVTGLFFSAVQSHWTSLILKRKLSSLLDATICTTCQ